MDVHKVDLFMMTNNKFFEAIQLSAIKSKLMELPESEWSKVELLQFKDPTTMLIVSLLGGSLGIDRFMMGDTGLGIAKLLTCGGAGIWTIVDWFSVTGKTKEINLQTLLRALSMA